LAEEQTLDEEEDDSRLSFRTTPPRSSIRGFIQRWKSEQSQHWEEHKRTLEVYHQAIYYLGSFYLTHGWLTTNSIVQFSLGSSVFGLTVLHAFFDPLQGFPNYFVYQRPRYLRIRKDYPEAGRIGAFCCILHFSYRPDPKRWKDQHIRAQAYADNIGSERRRERARATSTYLHSVAEAEIPTLSNGAREKIEKKHHWQAAHLTDSGRARSGRNYYLG
jgi:hypothetical protein